MRPLHAIADDILQAWKQPYFGAIPYLAAMKQLYSMKDHYGYDDARSIVTYFLANANTFRGEQARKLKAELREQLNSK